MSQVTRRGVFGAGLAGLAAACSSIGTGAPRYGGRVAFENGVASGDPEQTRVVIWTRVRPSGAAAVPVSWAVSTRPDFKQPVRKGYMMTGPERDHTVKVDVEGLEPGQRYYYWFWVGQDVSPSGQTQTMPASGVEPFKLAVASCSNFPFGYFNGYREIAKRSDVNAVIHLGDYIYEYGGDGYGGSEGEALGRQHTPSHEIVSLDDYRMRYAQYRSDHDLQAAHARFPWFCTWDDHESTDNSYRSGASNHQSHTEGEWSARKAVAVQAFMEWMPVRDPDPVRPREAIYRKVDIGDLATLFLLESRLVGRSDEITYDEIGAVARHEMQDAANAVKARIDDPSRTMLGAAQEEWLATGFAQSAAAGKRWQVLGNQVTMAKVKAPDLQYGLNADAYDTLPDRIKMWAQSAKFGLEWNPDSWCGFPAARERLYAAARAAGARVVTLTGDTHTAWANELHDKEGYRVGVEFGCSSITSPGMGENVPYTELNWLMSEANDEVVYYNGFDRGFTVLTMTSEDVEAEFVKISNIRSTEYYASTDARLRSAVDRNGVSSLTRPMGGGTIVSG